MTIVVFFLIFIVRDVLENHSRVFTQQLRIEILVHD